MHPISFPGLFPWKIHVSPDIFTIGNFSVRWYGVLIAAGLLLAMLYGFKRAKDFKITVDDLTDVIVFSLFFGIIGARLYYVLFYTPLNASGIPQGYQNPFFSDPVSILYIWEGGLGIYGGIIGAFVTALIVCKIKKISTGAVFDIASLGFLIGQAIGRWGNFFNQEAYGAQTNLPWRMQIFDSNTAAYIAVHPCFLYESIWCALGFILLHNYSKRFRKFNGEIFLLYVMWYSFGRFFIEALRSDSLYVGYIKISQLVASALFIAALALFVYKRSKSRDNAVSGYSSVYSEAAQALKEEEAELEQIQSLEENEEEDEGSEDEGNVPESADEETEKPCEDKKPEE